VALSWLRRTLGIAGYWSLAGYAKRKVKSAVSFICDFEESVVRDVKGRGYDGVVCGHIHAAVIRQIDGITYINCGDWVDSCTAVVEHFDGLMELIQWGAGLRPPALFEPVASAPASSVQTRADEAREPAQA
jgi:UDP-2,3-diacylglucosamine pyrophosphatase LpxH